jgi:S1-C subfamily serine protease
LCIDASRVGRALEVEVKPYLLGVGLALYALIAAGASWAAGDFIPGSDDWKLPSCERPISPAYPTRPPECNAGNVPVRPPGGWLAPPLPSGAPPAYPAIPAYPALSASPPPGTPAVAAPAPAAPLPIEVAKDGARPKNIRLTRVRTSLREGDRMGEIKTGTNCNTPLPVSMNSRVESLILPPLLRPVRDEFTRAGYADPIGERGLFEEDADQTHVDLLLGALVEDFNMQYCTAGAGTRIDGTVRVKVRWQLYDPVARKILLTTETEGSYRTAGSEPTRDADVFGRAYRETVRSLLADRKFYDLAVDSGPSSLSMADAASASAGSLLVLKRVRPFPGPLSANMTNLRAAVVTVSQGAGSGSGFFIGENGYVVTNSHVVAGNRFVRVKLVTGRELVGEVVKQDRARDVALIKTEGRNFIALPIAPGESNIGSEVTSIGSPLGESLSGTVTRGIVSGYRVINSKRFIQSDVGILPGNSGGPLLDASGRVVGIAVFVFSAGSSGRANFFVPIQEALDTLDLRLSD